MVVACHGCYSNPEGPAWTHWVSAFCSTGGSGVQIFFVLSGFLISQPFFTARLEQPRTWYVPGYATRRFFKIVPPFYLAILLLSLFYLWRYHDWVYVKTGLEWAVGIPHIIPATHWFNGTFWSLWVEVGFYVLLPLLFFLLRGCSVPRTVVVMAAMLLIIPFITRELGRPADTKQLMYFYARFPNGLTNFAWGVLFAGWYVKTRSRAEAMRRFAVAGYGGVALLLVTMLWEAISSIHGAPGTKWTYDWALHLPGLAAFLMLCFLFNPNSLGAHILSMPVLRYLGLISYEWFLLHQPILNEFRAFMVTANGNLARYLFVVGTPMIASLLAAALMYHFYSLPIIKWGRRRFLASEKQ